MVALDSTGEIGVVVAALNELGSDSSGLLSAETDHTIRLTGQHVEFVDPSVRSAIATAMSPAARRVVHRVVADG